MCREEDSYECMNLMEINKNLRRSKLRLLSGARLQGEAESEGLCLCDDYEGGWNAVECSVCRGLRGAGEHEEECGNPPLNSI